MVVRDIRKIYGCEFLQGFGGFWTLYRQQAVFWAHIGDGSAVVFVLFMNPSQIFVDVACIDYQQIFFCIEAINEQIIYDSACCVGHARVLYTAIVQGADIVGGDKFNQVVGFWAFNPNFTHVTHIKNTHSIAHAIVFLNEVVVKHGHVKPCERDHFCTQRSVKI